MWVLFTEAVEQEASQKHAERGRKTYIRISWCWGDLSWVTDAVPGFYSVSTRWEGYGIGIGSGGRDGIYECVMGVE